MTPDAAIRQRFVEQSSRLSLWYVRRLLATGAAPGRIGNRHASIAPYEMFKTSDGYVNVAAANEHATLVRIGRAFQQTTDWHLRRPR